MRLYLILFPLFLLVSSCGREPGKDPLLAARAKTDSARAVSFTMTGVWNNTFMDDTLVMDPHHAVYVRNEHADFPFDFVYETSNSAMLFREGQLKTVEWEERRVINVSGETAREDLAYEGNYATGQSPVVFLHDTAWVRSGASDMEVYYERTIYDHEDEEGHARTIERISIDSLASAVVRFERVNSLDGVVKQHIVNTFTDLRFGVGSVADYAIPTGFAEVSSDDLEKMQDATRLAPGDDLPEFELTDINGATIKSDDLRGKKVVFVFSFIGCGGCEYTRKDLARQSFQFSDEYVALYVNPVDKADRIKTYHTDKPWPCRMTTAEGDLTERFGVYAYPTFIAADEKGKVYRVEEGYEEAFFADMAAD